MNTDVPAISVKNLCKAFGQKVVLDGISMDVKRGESVCIIGGSGSGKSIFIKSILGLVHPEKGEILVNGENAVGLGRAKQQELMRKFGMLFQGGALFDSLTVWENISFALLQNRRISKQQAQELAVDKLKAVGLGADVARLRPAELSGGMQKRVALARAIAHNPEIIFFDEPTTGLDPIMADVINDLIADCAERFGLTTVSITHDMASVRKIGSRVAMLYKGKFIWDGPVADIDHSGNEYLDQFVHGRAVGPITQ